MLQFSGIEVGNRTDGLTAIDGVERLFDGPYFHEVALRLDRAVAPVLEALAAQDILGGFDLSALYIQIYTGDIQFTRQ